MSATRSVAAPRVFCATRAAASRGVRAGAVATPRACARSRKSFGFASRSRCVALSAADGEDAEADPDAVAPEDYALVVELLDSETGEELKEKVEKQQLRAEKLQQQKQLQLNKYEVPHCWVG